MPNKWFLRIGSFLFAFALLVGCANDDNNPENDQPQDAPMEEDGNNLEEDLEEEGNNMEDNLDMEDEGNNPEDDSDMLEHENEHGETE